MKIEEKTLNDCNQFFVYAMFNTSNGSRFAWCLSDNAEGISAYNHCDSCLRLLITCPEGYCIAENNYGNSIIIKNGATHGNHILYDINNHCIVEEFSLRPIKGVHILERIEYLLLNH